MSRFACLPALLSTIALFGCATNLGTGEAVISELHHTYPITVGRLVEAHLDKSDRLRVYLQACEERGPGQMLCHDDTFRMLAVVSAERKSLLERIDTRYLEAGKDMPIYVYGPRCEGKEEMIVIPRCQEALALGIWDPYLSDYVFYSTRHGSGSFVESEGFESFLNVTGRAAGIVKKAAR